MRRLHFFTIVMLAALWLSSGCATVRPPSRPDVMPRVDIPRFMGDWYVLASIPLWPERHAYNGIESYRLDEDGRIRTTYSFRDGGFDGTPKTYHPVATIHDRATGAEWRMQFLWPFRAAFLIHYVDEAYQTTIIGVPDRDYVWIMARSPEIPESTYQDLVRRAGDLGYDLGQLRRVPQQWATPAQEK